MNGLAKNRPVIVFDNAGVGQSSGATPDNVAHIAEDAARFMSALGMTNADLLGFSPQRFRRPLHKGTFNNQRFDKRSGW